MLCSRTLLYCMCMAESDLASLDRDGRAVSRCAGQFYLYKLDYRGFSSMQFSFSLDFGETCLL
jgi:hypothetical protein